MPARIRGTPIICLDCKQEKTFWISGLCRKCWTRNRFEKTLKKHAQPIRKPVKFTQRKLLARLEEYNRLRSENVSVRKIAETWKIPVASLSAAAWRLRRRGFNVISGFHSNKTPHTNRQRVDHGGGLSGKRNCKCEPCKARKKEYTSAYYARNRERYAAWQKSYRAAGKGESSPS